MWYETREGLAAKIEWEGGLLDAFDYGMTTDHLNPCDTELIAAWQKAEDAYKTLLTALNVLEALLPEGV